MAVVALCTGALAVAQTTLPTAVAPSLRVEVDATDFTPGSAGPAQLRVVLENTTDQCIAVPFQYDGFNVRVFGQGATQSWELSLQPVGDVLEDGPIPWLEGPVGSPCEGVAFHGSWVVAPGTEATIFSQSLAILLDDVTALREAGAAWTWTAHPTPPQSPIHAPYGGGYETSARFWAQFLLRDPDGMAGDVAVTSPPVEVRVVGEGTR